MEWKNWPLHFERILKLFISLILFVCHCAHRKQSNKCIFMIHDKALKRLHKFKSTKWTGRTTILSICNIVTVSFIWTCTIPIKKNLSSHFLKSEKYYEEWILIRFLTFTYTFLQNFERSGCFWVWSSTKERSAALRSLAKAKCFSIIPCVISRKHVWIITTHSEVVINMIAGILSRLKMFFRPIHFKRPCSFW